MNHIVLVHPAIPQNTGNIMRTCVATNTSLHIIKPMSFELDDKKVKRAGLDYIKDLDLHVYESYEEFKAKNPGEYHFFTRYSNFVIRIKIIVIVLRNIIYSLDMNMMEFLKKF